MGERRFKMVLAVLWINNTRRRNQYSSGAVNTCGKAGCKNNYKSRIGFCSALFHSKPDRSPYFIIDLNIDKF